ncbi:MAG: hypothetical protein ACRDOC_14145 [Streptosporangiaceae bacterium]
MPRFRPTARLLVLDPADRPVVQRDLVDRLVSDGVPTTPVRPPWRLGT